jgi:hypothetical protein
MDERPIHENGNENDLSPDLTRPADCTRHDEGTGPFRSPMPIFVTLLPPCNRACPAGEPSNIPGRFNASKTNWTFSNLPPIEPENANAH